MPPKRKASQMGIDQSVNADVLSFAKRPEYRPPRNLPNIRASLWPVCTDSAASFVVSDRTPICRDDYSRIGKAVLEQALFIMTLPHIHHEQPSSFTKILDNSVRSDAVLKEIMKKIDPMLLDGVGTAKSVRVDGGFHVLVAMKWVELGFNTPQVTDVFRPYFEPLLEVARAAYFSFAGKKSDGPTREQRVPAGMQFLLNARKISERSASPPVPGMFDSDSSDGESDGEGESDPEVQPAVNTQEDVYSLSDEESEPSFLALVPTFDDSPRAPLSFSPGPSTEYNNDFLQELAAPPVSPWKNLGLRLRPGPTYSSGDFKLGSGFELATAADGFLQDLESSPPPIFRKNGLCIDPSVRALGGESPLGPVFDSNRARFNTPPSEAKLPELFDRALVIKTPHCRLTSIRRPPLSPHNGQSGLPQPSDMSPHGRVLRFGM